MAKDSLSRLELTKKAFSLRKAKHETLALAFQQIKPILEKYMKENHILELELNLKNKHVLALEPIDNGERDLWIRLWLDGDASAKQLEERMKHRFQWVEYLRFSGFLENVEAWCKEKRGVYDA